MVKEKDKQVFLELADHSGINTSNFNDETMMTTVMDTEIDLKEVTVFK